MSSLRRLEVRDGLLVEPSAVDHMVVKEVGLQASSVESQVVPDLMVDQWNSQPEVSSLEPAWALRKSHKLLPGTMVTAINGREDRKEQGAQCFKLLAELKLRQVYHRAFQATRVHLVGI